ncbi:MAG: hypothetical protein NZM26_02820 [Patescibacteria group bacterium]|nr:hypothetical protein [Patescibacteria group bacterium]
MLTYSKKFFSALIMTLSYFAILFLIYWVHINYFKVNVVLYDAIIDCFIALAISTPLLFFLRSLQTFNIFEKVQLSFIWLLAGTLWAISVPTVIDRSLSFYILEKLWQRGGGIMLSSFQRVITEEYIKEHKVVEMRLTEQKESGTIEIENGCVILTHKGRAIAKFSLFFRKHFLPKQRLIMNSYSDALTEPFRESVPITDYLCKSSSK